MRRDLLVEWQELAKLYREMSDGELLALDEDRADLTSVAQQVLSDEMKKRALHRSASKQEKPPLATPFGVQQWEPVSDAPTSQDEEQASDLPHEYTWKTLLCECEDAEQARQLSAALEGAGIESWIEGPRTYSRYSSLDLNGPRVLVAADQLEQARLVAAQPIPQAILDQAEEEVEAFESPACPKCGAKDPILEGVDPRNTWLCENCDHRWTEAGDEPAT